MQLLHIRLADKRDLHHWELVASWIVNRNTIVQEMAPCDGVAVPQHIKYILRHIVVDKVRSRFK